MKSITLLIALLAFMSNVLCAQSLWDQLEAWEQEIKNDQISIEIEVKMFDAEDGVTVLDQSKARMVHDEHGYYAKMFDVEFFDDGDIGVTIDHEEKRIVLISKEKSDTMISAKNNPLSPFSSSATEWFDIQEENGLYQLTDIEDCSLLAEILMDKETQRVRSIRQYLPQKVRVEGEMKNVIIEMAYDYAPPSQRPRWSQLIKKTGEKYIGKSPYSSYHVLDNRKNAR